MTTIMPQSEQVRKAIVWISEMLENEPGKSLIKLQEEAGPRFNLSPKECEFLQRFYKEDKG
ncbi:MAG: hypothetical protein OCC46_07675 [Pseudodesulfovibrio sp.]